MSYALLRTRPEIVGFLPDEAVIVEISPPYHITQVSPSDTLVERAVVEYGNHCFVILRYDKNDDGVFVYTDNYPMPAVLHKSQIKEYIRNR